MKGGEGHQLDLLFFGMFFEPCVVAKQRNPARFLGNFITLAVEGRNFWGLARTVRRCVSRPPNQIYALRWLTRPFSAVFGRFPAIGHFGRKSPWLTPHGQRARRHRCSASRWSLWHRNWLGQIPPNLPHQPIERSRIPLYGVSLNRRAIIRGGS